MANIRRDADVHIDQEEIDLAEKHLLAIVYEELGLQSDKFPSHSVFARAVFGTEVNVPHNKWWRIREGRKRLSFSDIGRLGAALNIDITSMISRAQANARLKRPVPGPPQISEK